MVVNLNPTHEDDWDDAFQAIGNATGSNDFELSIYKDYTITFLPSSIGHLKYKQGKVKIVLDENRNLQRLPYDIGQLQNMVRLDVRWCPALTSLPWTIGRLPPTCKVVINTDRINRQTQTVKGMEPQFKVPRQRFITGLAKLSILSSHKGAKLIEELYRPGGRGYKRSREEFETAVAGMIAEEEE
eukprot:CAMPEP_0197259104 /NCGR_PEP_ID=MMETSP1429-20130617/83338_1 /TAXON_ID=49237 /ORGANISM="Chaetoceros  sp., Strain UNC1202" /LENGTH=184 /DNA_ID=CAMNT_0042723303 /DNA_START=567 /DNA_END=1120 /DNA_ORIENTATION=-